MDQKEEMRKRLLDLNKQRKEMELEIEAIECMLRESGFGLRGNLLDKDGFPIEDTEKLISVRQQRNRLAVLKTDVQKINQEIEKGVLIVFAK